MKDLKKSASQITHVVLDGFSLTLEEVVAVARFGAKVSWDEKAKKRVQDCRTVVEVLVEKGIVAYGVNTGFGALRNCTIAPSKMESLQKNLIRSHACGVGNPFSPEIVRAIILLRANTLARGNSGVRAQIIEALIEMLNLGICPYIPSQGSVGASGDLAPLSHMALVLIGDPCGLFMHFHPKNENTDASISYMSSKGKNLQKFSFTPLTLSYKEGLALNNGTQVMSAIACITLYDSFVLLHSAEMAMVMSLEGAQGVASSLDEKIHAARPLSHQREVAARLRFYIEDSILLSAPMNAALLSRLLKGLGVCHQSLTQAKAQAMLKDSIQKIVERLVAYQKSLAQTKPWELAANQKALEEAQDTARWITEKIDEMMVTMHSNLSDAAEKEKIIEMLTVLRIEWKCAVPSLCPTQDDYSFRCASQVIACAWRAWGHAVEVVAPEINSTTDNPLLFPPVMPSSYSGTYSDWLRENPQLCREAVISGGNFHGEPVGMVMDYLAIAISEIASMSERRVAHLVDVHHSNGLPPFLCPEPGLNSGFMIPQYTAAALVSENKVLAHPATVDSIPTSANTEDHVSMGTIAARKCKDILSNATRVVAIEMMVAHQALHFRAFPGGRLSQKIRKIFEELLVVYPDTIIKGIPFFQEDDVLYPIMDALAEAIRREKFLELVP